MRDHGLRYLRKVFSYHCGLTSFRIAKRVRIAAPRGMPRKTATLVAIVEYETLTVLPDLPMTLMNRRASGAYNTICSTELMATRIAQYSLSPPARPVQMSTIAMHLAKPTRMRPSLKPSLSGRKAHDRPSIKKGAMIQLTKMLNAICIQMSLFRKAWCSVSNLTLHRIGYIMISKPIAMGTETPTNFPF